MLSQLKHKSDIYVIASMLSLLAIRIVTEIFPENKSSLLFIDLLDLQGAVVAFLVITFLVKPKKLTSALCLCAITLLSFGYIGLGFSSMLSDGNGIMELLKAQWPRGVSHAGLFQAAVFTYLYFANDYKKDKD